MMNKLFTVAENETNGIIRSGNMLVGTFFALWFGVTITIPRGRQWLVQCLS